MVKGLSERGGAYILVLVVMSSVFVILAAAFNTVAYQMQAARAYRDNANLYDLAVSGAEQAEKILNQCLVRVHPDISSDTVEILQNMPFADIAMYAEGFHLKKPDSGGLRGESGALFKDLFASAAAEYIKDELELLFGNDSYSFSFGATVDEGDKEYNYVVSVDISVDISEIPTVYRILSYAQNTQADIKLGVCAEIILAESVGNETIIEKYSWQSVPPRFGSGIVAEYEDWDGVWDLSVDMSSLAQGWSAENPVYITAYPVVDISAFYDGGEPLPTVVLHTADTTLLITASDLDLCEFKGVIISMGSVEFDNVYIEMEGSLLSSGNITVNHVFTSVIYDAGMLFDIRFADPTDRRRLLDFLRLTAYKDAASPAEYNIDSILGEYIRIQPYIFEIRDSERIRFQIRSLYSL